MSPVILHLVVGPQAHGVVRHGLGLLDAAGASGTGELAHRLVRAESVGALGAGPIRTAEQAPAAVLHVSFTDALFGTDPEAAAEEVLRLRGSHLLSVGPHDVPQPQEGVQRFERRSRAYARLLRDADLVIAHSQHEAGQLRELIDGQSRTQAGTQIEAQSAVPVRVIPLPLEAPAPGPHARPGTDGQGAPSVGVLGFVYPGKGFEDVIDQAPAGSQVRAIGGIAAGHDADAAALAERAAHRGVSFEITGYVPEEELAAQLAAVDVPVCPHRHVSASGSLNTWIAHGRVPVVVDGPYMREIDERWPGRVLRCDRDRLGESLRELLAEPARTRAAQPPPSWGWPQVAAAYEAAWTELTR